MTVIERLLRDYNNPDSEELAIVALGLVAGTVGNVCAAVSIAIADFFAERDERPPLIDEARQAATVPGWGVSEKIHRRRARAQPACAIFDAHVYRREDRIQSQERSRRSHTRRSSPRARTGRRGGPRLHFRWFGPIGLSTSLHRPASRLATDPGNRPAGAIASRAESGHRPRQRQTGKAEKALGRHLRTATLCSSSAIGV